MGNTSSTDKMMKVQFDLKFAAKNFERESKKCYAREKKAKAQVPFSLYIHERSFPKNAQNYGIPLTRSHA